MEQRSILEYITDNIDIAGRVDQYLYIPDYVDKILGKEIVLDIRITYIAGDIIGKENKVTVTITKNGDIKDEYNNDSISVKSKEYYK